VTGCLRATQPLIARVGCEELGRLPQPVVFRPYAPRLGVGTKTGTFGNLHIVRSPILLGHSPNRFGGRYPPGSLTVNVRSASWSRCPVRPATRFA
jgi:hypothetical protein